MKAIGFQLPAAGRFRLDAFGFISRNSMAMISGLRPLSPFWRRQAPTSPAERYYITPWAEPSNRPEGGADPGQNPWLPGPQARRRHQPSSPQGRVNLREYSQAPVSPKSLLPQGPPPKGGIQNGAARHRTSPIGQPTKRKASYWAG